MNCNLRVQVGQEIKGEVTSPSWENREKFAASREKCFLTEDTPQKHGYIISSYELICFFLYFNIGPNNNKTKINKQKKKQEAHGLRVAHLSDIATADMQMLCNIFPILSSQLMKRSSFKQFFILKKIYGMLVN